MKISNAGKRITVIMMVMALCLCSLLYSPKASAADGNSADTTDTKDEVGVEVLGAQLRLTNENDNTGTQSMRIAIKVTNADKATDCAIKLTLNNKTYTVATNKSLFTGSSGTESKNVYSKNEADKSIIYSVVVTGIPKDNFNSAIQVEGVAVKADKSQIKAPAQGEPAVTKSVSGVIEAMQNDYPALKINEKDGVLYSYDDVLTNDYINEYASMAEKGAYLPNSDGKIVINAADALQNTKYASSQGASKDSYNWSWEAKGNGIQVIPESVQDNKGVWTDRNWEALYGKAPMLQYKIKIETAGGYYLFANMSNPNNNADSYHVAIDGEYIYQASTGEKITDKMWDAEKHIINLTAGEHTITIFAREDGLLINQILLSANKDEALTTGNLFYEEALSKNEQFQGAYTFSDSDGKKELVINAADALEQSRFASNRGAANSTTGGSKWILSGNGIRALEDMGTNWTYTNWNDLYDKAPYLQYKIKVETAGTYYLYANMSNLDDGADSYHVAIDGQNLFTATSGQKIVGNTGATRWFAEENNRIAFNLTAGYHTLTIFAREDGLFINQILLTDSSYTIKNLAMPVANKSAYVIVDDNGEPDDNLKTATPRESLSTPIQ